MSELSSDEVDTLFSIGSDRTPDRTLDRIGLRIGSDRIGLVSSLLVQKNYFEKSCFNSDTGGSE